MGDMDHAQNAPSVKSFEASEPPPQPTSIRPRTADRPHCITIALGLLSPLLALIPLGVSVYVFRDSQQAMRVGQRAYLGFHFESASVAPDHVEQATEQKTFRVEASVSVKDI